jgi:hypothetical protein
MDHGFGTNATYQFYRTERWLARVKAIYVGEYQPVSKWDVPLDHVLAFFLNCYHIKDWLKSGPEWQDDVEPSVKARAVEQFVIESEALTICGQLCNGNKHFRFDETLSLACEHTKFDTTTGTLITTTRFTFKTQRGDTDAYALAQECLEAWRSFIHDSTAESLMKLANRHDLKERHKRR